MSSVKQKAHITCCDEVDKEQSLDNYTSENSKKSGIVLISMAYEDGLDLHDDEKTWREMI